MKTSWHRQREHLREVMLDFLWDQWVLLEAAGSGRAGAVPFVIDPEALLVATIRFGGQDSRLRSEVLDWLLHNGKLISLQRLKNVQTATRVGTREGLVGISRLMEERGYRQWSSLKAWAEKNSARADGPFVPENFVRRGLSQSPDCRVPQAFILRLRALFGVSARPEVVAWLLTHRSGYAAEIASATGWFSKSVQVILHELELAGFLISEEDGKKRHFSIKPRQEIFSADLAENLRWFPQGWFYTGVLHLDTLLSSLQDSAGNSERARAIKIREHLTQRIEERLISMQAAFRLAGLSKIFGGCSGLAGEELVKGFAEGVDEVVQCVAARDLPLVG